MKIAVMGSGGWGLAMAKVMAEKGHSVTVWSHRPETTALLRREKGSSRLLRGVTLPDSVQYSDDPGCAAGCPVVAVAVPSFAVGETGKTLAPVLAAGQTLMLMSKGFDLDHGCCLLNETLTRETGGKCPVVALTGPSHAEEVSRGIPTAVVAASASREAAELVQRELSTDAFRIYTSPDIVSAELGGAMKNIMALAVGISDGYGYGDNTKAMLMTRGIREMSRLGQLLGGREETFSGLSGVGDLIVTCISEHSRNRRAGLLIGGGLPVEQAVKEVGAVVEGFYAAHAVHQLTAGQGVDMPICQAVYRILTGAPVAQVITGLLQRASRVEHDGDAPADLWA